MFLQLAKLSEIIGQILQGLYTTKAKQLSYIQGSDNLVTRLDHELTIWRFGLIKVLQGNGAPSGSEPSVTTPVAASIHLCYYAALLLLHRPFIEHFKQGKPNPLSSYSSFRICTSAAERAIALASNLSPSDFLRFSWSFNLYSLFQSGLMCIYNAKNTDARVSTRAKSNLAKCIRLLKRVRTMSASALKIDTLVHNMMKLQEVDLTGYQQQLEDTSLEQQDSQTKAENAVRTMLHPMPSTDYRSNISSTNTPTPSISTPTDPAADLIQPSIMVDSSEPVAFSSIGDLGASGTAEVFSLKQFVLSKDNEFSYVKALDSITGDSDVWSGGNTVKTGMQQQQNLDVPWNGIQNNDEAATSALFQSGYLMSGIPSKQDSFSRGFSDLMSAALPSNPAVAASESTLFRYTPNNPFWSIPASCDWDEWKSYYNQATPAVEGSSSTGVW